jgi:diguanylate cyclase (GGDEF)-like protein/PAS domain S-box-containing protein
MALGLLQSLGLRKRAKTGSLFGRFLFFLIPIFVVASMLGLALVSNVFLRAERDSINERISIFTTRIASVLKKEAELGNGRISANLVNLLLVDPAIHCVELIGGRGRVLANAPGETGCQKAGNRKTLLVPFADIPGSKLRVQYDEAEIATSEKRKEQFSMLAMLIGLFVAMGASWFSFRSIVERPMKVLLEAIKSAGGSGDVAIIKHQTADEMGEVIGAFNEMQVKLGEEARRNREALEHVDRLYNETPALMFSIDSNGLMLNVSGHWLEQTGYARKDVLGKAFSNFLRSSPGSYDLSFLLAELTARQELRDIPLQLVRRNETGMDVLLSAVADKTENGADACFLCVLNDVSSLKESQKKLSSQVVTDLLTGLPNRQGLFEYLSAMKPASEKFMERVAILYIDLDNFKWVNETHGHEAGDGLLIEVSRRLRACLTAADFLARLGGDEFAVVLRGLKQDDDAVAIGLRELGVLVAPFQLGEVVVHVGCSIGIALLGTHSSSAEELLRLADLAMYKSKQQGKNRISVYSSDLGDKALTRARVTDQIRQALRHNQLRLFYQPVINLNSLQVVGAEALLRLQTPEEGLMQPTDFITVAEETGLMGSVGDWVVGEALSNLQHERAFAADTGRYLAINLSPRQLDSAFTADLVKRLKNAPALAKALVFEVTETALLENEERFSQFFADIRETGARIALDDFGTGYSSLGHISRYPVDFIKLDRSFSRLLSRGSEVEAQRARALIKAMATLSAELGIAIIAEGIEDIATLDQLRSYGIGFGQGYLFSSALPANAFRDWAQAFSGISEAGQQKDIRVA